MKQHSDLDWGPKGGHTLTRNASPRDATLVLGLGVELGLWASGKLNSESKWGPTGSYTRTRSECPREATLGLAARARGTLYSDSHQNLHSDTRSRIGGQQDCKLGLGLGSGPQGYTLGLGLRAQGKYIRTRIVDQREATLGLGLRVTARVLGLGLKADGKRNSDSQ